MNFYSLFELREACWAFVWGDRLLLDGGCGRSERQVVNMEGDPAPSTTQYVFLFGGLVRNALWIGRRWHWWLLAWGLIGYMKHQKLAWKRLESFKFAAISVLPSDFWRNLGTSAMIQERRSLQWVISKMRQTLKCLSCRCASSYDYFSFWAHDWIFLWTYPQLFRAKASTRLLQGPALSFAAPRPHLCVKISVRTSCSASFSPERKESGSVWSILPVCQGCSHRIPDPQHPTLPFQMSQSTRTHRATYQPISPCWSWQWSPHRLGALAHQSSSQLCRRRRCQLWALLSSDCAAPRSGAARCD